MTMWSNLRFALIDDFWLFVGQFAEARNYAIRDVYESAAQLQAVVRSFRPLFVVATARNVTNPFDGRPDYSRVRFGSDVPAEDTDHESDEYVPAPLAHYPSVFAQRFVAGLKLSACHEGW